MLFGSWILVSSCHVGGERLRPSSLLLPPDLSDIFFVLPHSHFLSSSCLSAAPPTWRHVTCNCCQPALKHSSVLDCKSLPERASARFTEATLHPSVSGRRFYQAYLIRQSLWTGEQLWWWQQGGWWGVSGWSWHQHEVIYNHTHTHTQREVVSVFFIQKLKWEQLKSELGAPPSCQNITDCQRMELLTQGEIHRRPPHSRLQHLQKAQNPKQTTTSED